MEKTKLPDHTSSQLSSSGPNLRGKQGENFREPKRRDKKNDRLYLDLVIRSGGEDLSLDDNNGVHGTGVAIEGLNTLKGFEVPNLDGVVIRPAVQAVWPVV